MNYPSITVPPPWAHLLICGASQVYTAAFPPPESMIGQRLAIHAAKSRRPWREAPEPTRGTMERRMHAYGFGLAKEWPVGAVIGTVTVARAYLIGQHAKGRFGEVCKIEKRVPECINDPEWLSVDRYWDFSKGRWAWVLEAGALLSRPIPARGHGGIWHWEPVTEVETEDLETIEAITGIVGAKL